MKSGIVPSMPLTDRDFSLLMDRIEPGRAIAVAVSGGPDSMALCWMLSQWASAMGVRVHAVTVDHGLRPEAAQEAKDVGISVQNWPAVTHTILRWEGEKPQSRILEEARNARYRLLTSYMREHGINHLFTAHQQDDQAETFLFRLAKGSGLDGLAAMKPRQEMEEGMTLCRPLLGFSKEDLISLCKAQGIPFVMDPTNENSDYLRPRLRAARAVLEEEGLTSKRLSVTAARLGRARQALEILSDDLANKSVKSSEGHQIAFDWPILKAAPEELILRVLLSAIDQLYPDDDYGPRMEKMENLMTRLLNEEGFKSATLGGCIFALSPKNDILSIAKEKP